MRWLARTCEFNGMATMGATRPEVETSEALTETDVETDEPSSGRESEERAESPEGAGSKGERSLRRKRRPGVLELLPRSWQEPARQILQRAEVDAFLLVLKSFVVVYRIRE